MYEQNILGGEAAMWSEQVEGVAVEAKLWPRVAALGERLWADPESGNTKHWECYPDFLGALKLSNFHRIPCIDTPLYILGVRMETSRVSNGTYERKNGR